MTSPDLTSACSLDSQRLEREALPRHLTGCGEKPRRRKVSKRARWKTLLLFLARFSFPVPDAKGRTGLGRTSWKQKLGGWKTVLSIQGAKPCQSTRLRVFSQSWRSSGLPCGLKGLPPFRGIARSAGVFRVEVSYSFVHPLR